VDVKKVKKQALKEIYEEEFEGEVLKYKERLKNKLNAPWYKKIIPFRVVLLSRDKAYLLNQLIEVQDD